jgi:hypothetical protein
MAAAERAKAVGYWEGLQALLLLKEVRQGAGCRIVVLRVFMK